MEKQLTRYRQRWFCEECLEVHPAPHLSSKRLCGYQNCLNEIGQKQNVCCELHGLLLARERGRSIRESPYRSPLVPTGDWLFAERQRLRRSRPDLSKYLRSIADHASNSNSLYYIEVGNLNVPPGWLPALASLGFAIQAEALVESTLSAGWLIQILDEVSERRAALPASVLAEVWFGLSERGLRRWAHERKLLPQCFLPALYFHRLAQPELQQ